MSAPFTKITKLAASLSGHFLPDRQGLASNLPAAGDWPAASFDAAGHARVQAYFFMMFWTEDGGVFGGGAFPSR